MWLGCSLNSTVRHVLPSELGRTHASTVIPVVRSRSLASAIETTSLIPSNDSAPPVLPAAFQVGPLIVPGWFLPDTSASVVPLPASKLYAATRSLPCVVKFAVSVESALGTVTVWAFAPPSDHEANTLLPCGDGVSIAYWNPTISPTVNGVVLGTPSTVTLRPDGTLANVRLTFRGLMVTDRDAWMPSLSVAVRTIS